MNHKSIILRTEEARDLVQAGRVTVRRRIDPQPPEWLTNGREPWEIMPGLWVFAVPGPVMACRSENTLRCPYGAAGEVREVFGRFEGEAGWYGPTLALRVESVRVERAGDGWEWCVECVRSEVPRG